MLSLKKTLSIILAVLVVAVVANAVAIAQTVIYAPAPAATPSSGYTYFNTITPSGQSQTGFVYSQPSSPTTGFQQNMTTGEQSTYVTSGNTTLILPLNSK